MEHHELVQEMPSIERMSAQERLKHAKKRRSQQMKKWNQYEKQLEKDNTKKPRKKGSTPQSSIKKSKRQGTGRVQFVANIALLESAARNDIEEGRIVFVAFTSCVVNKTVYITAVLMYSELYRKQKCLCYSNGYLSERCYCCVIFF